MQYDKDMQGEFAKILKKLEKIILSFNGIKVRKNAKQTSYYDEYSTVVMLRDHGKKFVTSWAKGVVLQKDYPFMKGDGKIVRHIEFTDIKQIDEKIIRELIKETMILNMEAYEIKQMRKELKK